MWVYFSDDILIDSRRQLDNSKEAKIAILHREFPNPKGYRFARKAMLAHIYHVLKSRQGTARAKVNIKGTKPIGL